MKIAILGTAFPFRGGLSAFNERLASAYQDKGDDVKIFTFTTQYPKILFPGKTQFSEESAPESLKIERSLSSINPFTWFSTARKINRFKPDVLIVKFWLPFMGAAFGTVLRRLNKNIQVICIVDNLIPHEKRIGDRILTKYFIKPVDGFLCMSKSVKDDFKHFSSSAPVLFSPHPIYNYGELITKEEARKNIGLDPQTPLLLFFGIIRDYKGLDWLLEAFAHSDYKLKGTKLLIAGEFYSDDKPYKELIEKHQLNDYIHLHDRFINDSDVYNYFNASDLVIQPYKHATQSGVTQIAFHFEKPMIVTNVGGLSEIVPHGEAGFVAEPNVESITQAINEFFADENPEQFIEGVRNEKSKYSWEIFMNKIAELIKQ